MWMRTVFFVVFMIFNLESPLYGNRIADDLSSDSKSKIYKTIKNLSDEDLGTHQHLLTALQEGRLFKDKAGQLFIKDQANADRFFSLQGQESIQAADWSKIRINNKIRRLLRKRLTAERVDFENFASVVRYIDTLRPSQVDEKTIIALRSALKNAKQTEFESKISNFLSLAEIESSLNTEDMQTALARLAEFGGASELSYLKNLDQQVFDPKIKTKITETMDSIEGRLWLREMLGHSIYGLSLASILLLAALGLAITFGLMGVINMAHGEMLMLGAYTTYMVQQLCTNLLPGALDFYILLSLPAAFLVAAAMGYILEKTVVRWLYGRPLETLLATWGISLILIQAVRLIFGAQNVELMQPAWLTGGFEITKGFILPANRIFAMVLSISMFVFCWFVIKKSRFGLKLQAVQQNREVAAGLGIDTNRVDALTFALGSGIAGVGGVALTQIGNVGPELGQSYIIDSFMVVVLGGVGELVGTLTGALALGMTNKFLEPVLGSVFGKILVMFLLILFIQKRPKGFFALKGRVTT